jgi:hypothetical protein
MTARRIRDLRRLLESVAEPFGATVLIEQTRGSHLRGVFTVGARRAVIITGFSPGDWRVPKKIQSDARRKLRKLTGGADLKVTIAQRVTERSAP